MKGRGRSDNPARWYVHHIVRSARDAELVRRQRHTNQARPVTVATTYDNTDTPLAISLKNSSTTLQSFICSDSPAGTILCETDTPSSPQSPATYTYDAKTRVTSMTPGSGSTLNYTFDASSNLTALPTGASTGYDHAGELTSSTLSGTTTSYARTTPTASGSPRSKAPPRSRPAHGMALGNSLHTATPAHL